jgi:hypothetical protein
MPLTVVVIEASPSSRPGWGPDAALATVDALAPANGLSIWQVPAVVGTALIALAGLFISADSLGGFTSDWIR